ncbi:glycerol-3-phosphate dehydrogenase subunit GlpB [Vibrio parahaemolyticus]|uniref:glycerol-3-phosphate dehydrogenase subunit GlpB n=1 Tax=Vibrio parahaemolyticus TaxID=670 RepID=UPI00111D9900|nr:glycerol-3-phosphate dehydrogenase subunit GlpB [Vibrio parahaemolyticus]TOG88804.1 anaerobic glycerol-3-phosphate dehydrogenase subunit B [Vibrio parahaemolyticus]
MKFDSIIIGGGVAGLSCAIRCAEAGMKTAVVAAGQSALHFSSGSVDVLSRLPNGEQVSAPFSSFRDLKNQCPSHPYSKLGELQCREAIHWYQDVMARCGVYLTAQADENNHYRVTPMGTFRSTWLSQQTVHQFPQEQLAQGLAEIALVTVDGFRDFQPQLAADNLSKLSAFEGSNIKTAAIELPDFDYMQRNPCEFRSIDISRVLRDETKLHAFAKSLIQQVGKADLVVLPAIFGNSDGAATIKQLEGLTGFKICELPTMPPSLLGIRLEEAMKSHYKCLGGLILAGDEVLSGEFNNQRLVKIFTRNHEDIPLMANHFLLASGSFFNKGLSAQRHEVSEPIFDLDMAGNTHQDHWYQPQLFAPQSHPFMKMGVDCNNQLNPSINDQVIKNLYCAGAILAHYDPIQEGSGAGVAISTGYYVAQQMINAHQHQEQHSTDTRPEQERTSA